MGGVFLAVVYRSDWSPSRGILPRYYAAVTKVFLAVLYRSGRSPFRGIIPQWPTMNTVLGRKEKITESEHI